MSFFTRNNYLLNVSTTTDTKVNIVLSWLSYRHSLWTQWRLWVVRYRNSTIHYYYTWQIVHTSLYCILVLLLYTYFYGCLWTVTPNQYQELLYLTNRTFFPCYVIQWSFCIVPLVTIMTENNMDSILLQKYTCWISKLYLRKWIYVKVTYSPSVAEPW